MRYVLFYVSFKFSSHFWSSAAPVPLHYQIKIHRSHTAIKPDLMTDFWGEVSMKD